MATGRSMQLTKQIGEYLVAAELCRRGLTATTFTGNVPWYDIVALDGKQDSVTIQVKTIKSNTWQFDASKFVDIEISENGVQTAKGKKPRPFPNMIYVFVQLVGTGEDNFYLLYHHEFHDIIYEGYCELLKLKKGRRPRNPRSTHKALLPTTLEPYRDNWALVKKELDRIKNNESIHNPA